MWCAWQHKAHCKNIYILCENLTCVVLRSWIDILWRWNWVLSVFTLLPGCVARYAKESKFAFTLVPLLKKFRGKTIGRYAASDKHVLGFVFRCRAIVAYAHGGEEANLQVMAWKKKTVWLVVKKPICANKTKISFGGENVLKKCKKMLFNGCNVLTNDGSCCLQKMLWNCVIIFLLSEKITK